jgi:murein DD-endopeptidase MepM/ murein hydrolase activator NlpD
VDIMAPKGTPIHAAATGTVITVRCNAHTAEGAPFSCDVDGSPSIMGCSWYLELLHADRTVTRYCHMLRQPLVQVGQTVNVGQVIGLVGTSGRSSGPHLHLESHLHAPASEQNAVEPISYLAQRGVAL